jgi:hypothetical protein
MAVIHKRVQPDRIKYCVMHIYSYRCKYRCFPLKLTPGDLLRTCSYQDFLSGIFHFVLYKAHAVMPFEGAAMFVVSKPILHIEEYYCNFDWPQILHEYSCKPKGSHGLNGSVTEWKHEGSDDAMILDTTNCAYLMSGIFVTQTTFLIKCMLICFCGVTVLEGEAKKVCSLDLGRGKYNESNWCEKRIVTSHLSVDWRCKHTKFYTKFYAYYRSVFRTEK